MAAANLYLRKLAAPFGTDSRPLWEFAYHERVRVAGGLATCKHRATQDRLVKMGYAAATAATPSPVKGYVAPWQAAGAAEAKAEAAPAPAGAAAAQKPRVRKARKAKPQTAADASPAGG